MSDLYLKIKIKSLAEEARMIRREEKALPGQDPRRESMYLHRIQDVRSEARAALVAYGFMRGKKYRVIENRTYTEPNWKRIAQLLIKYGEADSKTIPETLRDWRAGYIVVSAAA